MSFAKEGCSKIVIADRNTDGLNDTSSTINSVAANCEVVVVQTDVSKQESVQSLIDEAVKKFGRVDYVCNAAGIRSPRQVRRRSTTEAQDRHAEQQRAFGRDYP